jgi:diguanylate cyclase (GGDEF)-like protein/PAS domain S-box-containing protein
VGIWEFRRKGDEDLHWWSERFYELVGYGSGELAASTGNFIELIHPEDRAKVQQTALAAAGGNTTTNVNARLLTKNHGYRWFNLRTHWQHDVGGRIECAAGAIADIHDRLEAETALKTAQAELTHLAFTDPMTGVGNRRAFDDRLEHELARCIRNKTPLSLLLIDLDYFKLFNDRYGHPAGDDCLRRVAACIQNCIRRPADFAARIGGEEFAVILPETASSGATTIAEIILAAVRDLKILHEDSPVGAVSPSIGVAVTANGSVEPAILFANADKALYEAKHAGRNRIQIFAG